MSLDTTSFISKTTVLPSPVYKSKGLGFLTIISVVLLVVSFAALAGVWLYMGVLRGDMDRLSADFDKTKKEFDIASIQDLSAVSTSIDVSKKILQSHVAVSRIMDMLEQNTLPDVRFSNFNYGGGGGNLITLAGDAKSYTTLAEQALVLESIKNVESLSLSNLSLRGGGRVGFDLFITIKPDLINYQVK
ncbi:MAG: hypothetical protein HZC14_03115 [Candidatus Niyogibacteria bacterium]|nr:hypothetical protein [Candidatus Niyogibacteria bacterium]